MRDISRVVHKVLLCLIAWTQLGWIPLHVDTPLASHTDHHGVQNLIIAPFQNEVVNVRLPRFKISSDVQVVDALKSIGLQDIFDPDKSDLSLMAPADQVYLSSIAHK